MAKTQFPARGVAEQFVDIRWKQAMPRWADNFKQHRAWTRATDPMDSSVGITGFLHQGIATSYYARGDTTNYKYAERPNALIKWTSEDYFASDLWAGRPAASQPPPSELLPLHSNLRLTVLTDCVHHGSILDSLSRHIPGCAPQQMSIATDLDVLGRRRSAVLLRQLNEKQAVAAFSICGKPIRFGTSENNFFIVESVDPFQSRKPMPDTRHQFVLRSVKTSMDWLLKKLEALSSSGFINYCSFRRHGLHARKSFAFGKHLMERRYTDAIALYLSFLAADHAPVARVIGALQQAVIHESGLSNRDAWYQAKEAISTVMTREKSVVSGAGCCLVHHYQLIELAKFVHAVPSFQGDGAAILRELIAENILRDHLTTVADVLFNSVASLRIELLGKQVVPGDLVCIDPAVRWDEAEIACDVLPTHHPPRWHEIDAPSFDSVKIVESLEEAARYCLHDVLIPKPGQGELPLYPTHKCGREAFEMLSRELGLTGLSTMRLAPPSTYRRLVQKPLRMIYALYNDSLGFSAGSPDSIATFVDADGVRRQSLPNFPLVQETGDAGIGRRGIRDPAAREILLRPVRSDLSVFFSMDLPRGAALGSYLREFCQPTTIDSGTAVAMALGFRNSHHHQHRKPSFPRTVEKL